jgi:hypothetical protein
MIMDWREALACAGRLIYFVTVAGVIFAVITWAAT